MKTSNDIAKQFQELLFLIPTTEPKWLERFKELTSIDGKWEELLIEVVHEKYRLDTEAKDGFGRVGWFYLAKNKAEDALRFFKKDKEIERLGWWTGLRYAEALAALGKEEQAYVQVESIYEKHKAACNGYACIAWRIRKNIDPQTAVDLVRRDESSNRLTIGFALNYAELFARAGYWDEATCQVEKAYSADPNVKNGYSRIASIKAEQRDWDAAFDLAVLDEKSNRISPDWQVNLAQFYGRRGDFDTAAQLIDAAYATNASIKDAYARLGWLKAENQDWVGAFALMERDRVAGRVSPGWQVNLAQLYGRRGDFDAAIHLIESAYAKDKNLMDAYARLGSIFMQGNKWKRAIELMELDREKRRITTEMNIRLASSYMRSGHVRRGISLLGDTDSLGEVDPSSFHELVLGLTRIGNESAANRLIEKAYAKDSYGNRKWKNIRRNHYSSPLHDIENNIEQMFEPSDLYSVDLANYLRLNSTRERIFEDFKIVRQYADKNAVVMDVGCVPPLLLSLLKNDGYSQLIAVDPGSDRFSGYFKKHNIKWVPKAIESPVVVEMTGPADFVCFCEVIEHIAGNIARVVEHICELVKPKGMLLVSTPNLRSVSGFVSLLINNSGLASKRYETVRQQYERSSNDMASYGHVREYTRKEIVDLFESFGMKEQSSIMKTSYNVNSKSDKFIYFTEKILPAWRSNQQIIFKKS